MIRDAVRTDAYRDFIYDNKDLFADRTVLDIGTGTGILSMFAAKAGAKRVYAVDNSEVIEKARQIVKDNKLDEQIQCLHGRVESITLPTSQVTNGTSKGKEATGINETKVDLIVSEWMGYGLLYESMLDSVLHARDRFLRPDVGLMAPSHTTLRIAPVSDADYVLDTMNFWDSVYGFDMRAMDHKIYDDVIVRSIDPKTVVGSPSTFRTIDLHSVTVPELEFKKAEFGCEIDRDEEEGLSAFVIWFDTFFLTSRKPLPADAVAESWKGSGNAFTTGPYGKDTHWKSCLCVIDHTNKRKLVDGTVDKVSSRYKGQSLLIVLRHELKVYGHLYHVY